jgi:hypothetical protein
MNTEAQKKGKDGRGRKLSFNFTYIGYSRFGFQIANPQFYIFFNKLIICDFTFHFDQLFYYIYNTKIIIINIDHITSII